MHNASGRMHESFVDAVDEFLRRRNQPREAREQEEDHSEHLHEALKELQRLDAERDAMGTELEAEHISPQRLNELSERFLTLDLQYQEIAQKESERRLLTSECCGRFLSIFSGHYNEAATEEEKRKLVGCLDRCLNGEASQLLRCE